MDYLSDGITESIISSLSHLPQLRVMSRNAVSRFKGPNVDAQRIGRDLGVDAVLLGRVQLLDGRLLIRTELVDVTNGWQLWGENYDRETKAILELQEEIARQISTTLRLKLTGDDEQQLTHRYTESAEAYQAYLQGRYHWSTFTREGLEQATLFFREAINLDPNYALAYSGIVDCYLRLATNYIPPPETQTTREKQTEPTPKQQRAELTDLAEVEEPVKTRYRWDWTGVERELKRARELKSNYPAAHQWHAAYLFALQLYKESLQMTGATESAALLESEPQGHTRYVVEQIRAATPTAAEETQIFCAIAREQIEAGNYKGACKILKRHWTIGEWPRLDGLSSYSAGDLLFTTGSLMGCVSGAQQLHSGQKLAEALLNGAIGIFENLALRTRSAEAQIELAFCYFRDGLFDLARSTMIGALKLLPTDNLELKSIALIRLGIIERQAGNLAESLARLQEAEPVAEVVGPRVSARHHQELATTLKELNNTETARHDSEEIQAHYRRALYEFQAVGHHRYAAAAQNNHGYLLMTLGQWEESEQQLCRARSLFESLDDKLCSAQVDETLARLHLAQRRYDLAERSISKAVKTLSLGTDDAILTESLTTQGLILMRMGRQREGTLALYHAAQLAQRCGDNKGERRALAIMVEEGFETLDAEELEKISARLDVLADQLDLPPRIGQSKLL